MLIFLLQLKRALVNLGNVNYDVALFTFKSTSENTLSLVFRLVERKSEGGALLVSQKTLNDFNGCSNIQQMSSIAVSK